VAQWAMDEERGYISRGGILMRYKVKLERSEEGVAASVPGLPGCWSQGETEDEAMRNIEDAIRGYLDVIAEQLKGAEVREIEIAV
jgi:predicted RNase H-like HicB family nuclease